MDQILLLDVATELGYELAMCGAETFRVEESINRILQSYGIQSEVFAIPNCLTVSIETAEDTLTITVSDNGCGMSEEMLRSVCDPFTTTRTSPLHPAPAISPSLPPQRIWHSMLGSST